MSTTCSSSRSSWAGSPRRCQQKVLLIGIVLVLVMRGAFIAARAALISWVFHIFGVFLVYFAITLVKGGENDEEGGSACFVR